MKNFTRLAVLLCFMVFLSSCKEDIELYEDYKDITQVVGVVTADKGRTYIKIAKAFGGPGNANLSAKIPDSSTYQYKLDVKLIEELSNGKKRVIQLDTINIHNKEEGVFFSPTQQLYYVDDSIIPGTKYKLSIKKNNGEEVTSEITTPLKPSIKLNTKIANFHLNTPINIQVKAKSPTPLLEAWVGINYREINIQTGKVERKRFQWKVGQQTIENFIQDNEYLIQFIPIGFFDALVKNIPNNPNVIRKLGYPEDAVYQCVDVMIYAGDYDLYLYSLSNNGKLSLLQDKDHYSNIKNGLGIFGGIAKKGKLIIMSQETVNQIRSKYPYMNFQI